MANSIKEWQDYTIEQIQKDEILKAKLTSTSKTAIWRLWTFVTATIAWTLDSLFDKLKEHIAELIALMKPHRLQWYHTMAKRFQYGYELPYGEDRYKVIDEDARIIAYAAVDEIEEHEKPIRLVVKAAVDDGNGYPQQPSVAIQEAFKKYMKRIRDAGVRLDFVFAPGDELALWLHLFYDPLVLDAEGRRLDGTNATPVQDAIRMFIKNLPFNGEFSLAALTDALQVVEGVIIPTIQKAETRYELEPWQMVDIKMIPHAGFLNLLDENLHVTLEVYEI